MVATTRRVSDIVRGWAVGWSGVFTFFFNDTATTEIYTLSLHDALPIWSCSICRRAASASRQVLKRSGSSPSCAGYPSRFVVDRER